MKDPPSVFYHGNTDGHADACSAMDNPIILCGVYHLPHQHHWLANAAKDRETKS